MSYLQILFTALLSLSTLIYSKDTIQEATIEESAVSKTIYIHKASSAKLVIDPENNQAYLLQIHDAESSIVSIQGDERELTMVSTEFLIDKIQTEKKTPNLMINSKDFQAQSKTGTCADLLKVNEVNHEPSNQIMNLKVEAKHKQPLQLGVFSQVVLVYEGIN